MFYLFYSNKYNGCEIKILMMTISEFSQFLFEVIKYKSIHHIPILKSDLDYLMKGKKVETNYMITIE